MGYNNIISIFFYSIEQSYVLDRQGNDATIIFYLAKIQEVNVNDSKQTTKYY